MHAAALRRAWDTHALRRGFSNAEVMLAVGLVALVMLLLQIQSGELNPLAMFAKKPALKADKGKAGGKKLKQPPMLTFPADPLPGAAQKYLAQRKQEQAAADSARGKVWHGLARMDPLAAAALLAALDPATAADVLRHLKPRELAPILESAPPALAAQWATALLNQPAPAEIPEPFRAEAVRQGLYDDTAELLQQYAEGQAGGADSSVATPPEDGGTGAAATDTPGAAATAPSGAAATDPAGAETADPTEAAPGVLPSAYHPYSSPSSQYQLDPTPPPGGKRAGNGEPAQRTKRRLYPPGTLPS